MRTHEAVLARIEADLAAGRLRLGGRLPPERALAEQLGVSRASVREAVRVLEAMGVVRAGVGSGPEAGTVVVADPAVPLSAAVRLHLGTRALPIGDVVDARVLLETWAAAAAATHDPASADPASADPATAAIARAEELLAAMEPESLSADAFHRLDAEFHVALADAAGNVLVSAVMVALREAVHSYVMTAVAALPDWAGTARRLRAEHAGILAAVRGGDPAAASAAVRAHIVGFYAEARVSGLDG
ncbi:FadR/GntR family transcriptional regulator [Kineococcus rubinsiae]|uniref:FadR/GntR family transcriptional regulator n=1 Tax=Kineococcus rubinsiae TaxID=2609562 RepID=UPI001430F435|nr:GntR family transcriptional regulator [Kineococcus rubinsiae]NIZ92093.1 FadR family transcriptional regulator [Kineococcus rubinsiae]